ncbi:MAG: hypothetical protein B6D56_06200 [Candidatus Omnitrophica bacterium 4484_70.1]|nr:MAG: hypothetical protein B6D56_06200 [Candidatus Omnitrophica bacterium 4484_70.1]
MKAFYIASSTLTIVYIMFPKISIAILFLFLIAPFPPHGWKWVDFGAANFPYFILEKMKRYSIM